MVSKGVHAANSLASTSRNFAASTQLEFDFAREAKEFAYLYQKVGANGEHLKFGVTNNLQRRYTMEELGGGTLRPVAYGQRSEMLELERLVHETLPLGPEERQWFYIQKQIERGLNP